jgi:hypothetical protein
MATTSFREDHMGRDLIAPTVNSLDYTGRATTATVDHMGRPLRRILRANTTAVTLGQELQFVGGEKFLGPRRRWAPLWPTVRRRCSARSRGWGPGRGFMRRQGRRPTSGCWTRSLSFRASGRHGTDWRDAAASRTCTFRRLRGGGSLPRSLRH